MRSIGFPKSKKDNEKRRAIIPPDLQNLKEFNKYIYVEEGYGEVLGISDADFLEVGVNVVKREEVLRQDIICDPKIGDAEYLHELRNQTVFGWVHAVQNRETTQKLLYSNITAYAWEDMFECGRHSFYINNQLAGQAAIIHAFTVYGEIPSNCNVALLGKGNVAEGALKALNSLSANVTTYGRNSEKLFQKEFHQYDVIVNAILWDTTRDDHIIYKDDLQKMKSNAFIIDISCDEAGGIESTHATTISDPVYYYNGVLHYAVDNTPTMFFRTVSSHLSEVVSRYIPFLMKDEPNDVLQGSKIIDNGTILDDKIISFQSR